MRMTWKKTAICLLCLISGALFAQDYNLSETAHINVGASRNSDHSDIWGYVDETGVEYALVGVNNAGVSVVSLADPSNPVEVFFAQAKNNVSSIWRDIKTFGDFAFVTNENGGGLQIINLEPLPNNPPTEVFFYDGEGSWSTSHNLFIDDKGFAYVFGANKGLKPYPTLILDVNDPYNIQQVGKVDAFYAHDGIVRNDTLYLANINNGFFSILDITDRANPRFIATKTTPNNFSHNLWVSDNGQYLFTTDEKSKAFLASYDISDVFNIRELDRIQSLRNEKTIIHNTHFINDYVVTSYYRDGVTIHDVQDPSNVIEVGHFDTSPNYEGNGFNGCWGVYPWLPSGLIIASDIEEGLYVLNPNYQRGKVLIGVVKNAISGQVIQNATLSWEGTTLVETTKSDGTFKSGFDRFGNYNITVEADGYITKTVNIDFTEDGQLLEIELEPAGALNIEIYVSGVQEDQGIEMVLSGPGGEYFSFNKSGDTFSGVLPGDYELFVGKWGYLEEYIQVANLSADQRIEVNLVPGYSHQGNLDLGVRYFTEGQGAPFVRDVPLLVKIGVSEIVSPDFDSQNDPGTKAFLTGNASKNVESNDLDDEAVLIFPSIPFANTKRWMLTFDYHFYESESGLGSLELEVIGENETKVVLLSGLETGQWNSKSQLLADLPTGELRFNARSTSAQGVVDFALDNFLVVPVALKDGFSTSALSIFPNPASDEVVLDVEDESIHGIAKVQFIDAIGRVNEVELGFVSGKAKVDVSAMPGGLYLVRVGEEGEAQRMVVQREE
ncbi:MAG: choice-of-anchor B domain-containing protein [Luteibaculaceae bacterium]|jgi:choice-of-anchor B domain-containing protein